MSLARFRSPGYGVAHTGNNEAIIKNDQRYCVENFAGTPAYRFIGRIQRVAEKSHSGCGGSSASTVIDEMYALQVPTKQSDTVAAKEKQESLERIPAFEIVSSNACEEKSAVKPGGTSTCNEVWQGNVVCFCFIFCSFIDYYSFLANMSLSIHVEDCFTCVSPKIDCVQSVSTSRA